MPRTRPTGGMLLPWEFMDPIFLQGAFHVKPTPRPKLCTPGIFREREAAIILLYCYRFYRKNDAATPTKSQVYAGDLRAEMHGIHPGQYGKEVNKHVRKVRGSINKGWNWWHH